MTKFALATLFLALTTTVNVNSSINEHFNSHKKAYVITGISTTLAAGLTYASILADKKFNEAKIQNKIQDSAKKYFYQATQLVKENPKTTKIIVAGTGTGLTLTAASVYGAKKWFLNKKKDIDNQYDDNSGSSFSDENNNETPVPSNSESSDEDNNETPVSNDELNFIDNTRVKNILERAGITSREYLEGISDLQNIKGIGSVYEEYINNALENFRNSHK